MRKTGFADSKVTLSTVAFRMAFTAIILSNLSCVTETREYRRNSEQTEYLKDALRSSKYSDCVPEQAKWTIPAPVRAAKIVWGEKNPALIYEGTFRDGIKTVYQPLNANLEFAGEGFVLGLKDTKTVVDFVMQTDSAQNTWASYRYKRGNSQVFNSAVEFLEQKPGAQLVRIPIPSAPSDSVQQIWTVPTPIKGVIQVVVRVNSINTRFSQDEKEASNYLWYIVNVTAKAAKLIASYPDAENNLTSTSFIGLGKSNEPLAISILQSTQNKDSPDPKLKKQNFKVVARRLFSRDHEELAIAESTQPLSSLIVHQPNLLDPSVGLAWIKEPENAAYPTLQWALTKLEFGKITYKTQKNSVKNLHDALIPSNQQTLELPHFPGQIRFFIPSKNSVVQKQNLSLGWIANLDNDFAFVNVAVLPPVDARLHTDFKKYPQVAQPLPISPPSKRKGVPAVTVEAKKTIPPLSASATTSVFSVDPSGKAVGVSEAKGTLQPSYLIIAEPNPKPDSPTTVLRFCKFEL